MAASPPKIRLPLVTPARLLEPPGHAFVDLRSPSEFLQDHIPGAVNVPLFDDLERALVGTLYARRSPEEAFEVGARKTREKIQAIVFRIAELAGWSAPEVDLAERVDELTRHGIAGMRRGLEAEPAGDLPEGALVLGCWRGGLRSQSVVALLRELGLPAFGLEGGYRAYRALVCERIETWSAPACFVLRGLTGVGKTLVLNAMERLRPGWTVDLEHLAGHRSSILGMVGREPCSQRTFESRLRQRLSEGFPGPCVFEGESRKVGDIILPAQLWEALSGGTGVELVAPLGRRVDVLIEDYLEHEENRAALAAQLPFIEERLGSRKWSGVLVNWLATGEERRLVEVLLESYYDPLYRRSEAQYTYGFSVDTSDPEAAARSLVGWIEGRG